MYLPFQAMQEAEIRRFVVPGQPRQKSLQDPNLNRKEWGMVCLPVIIDGGKHKIGRSQSRWVWEKNETLSPKYQSKMGCRHGSNDRVLPSTLQSSEIKLQYCQN
jgi:hypothetical protein